MQINAEKSRGHKTTLCLKKFTLLFLWLLGQIFTDLVTFAAEKINNLTTKVIPFL